VRKKQQQQQRRQHWMLQVALNQQPQWILTQRQ
jgi:hypothetical protein